MVAILKESLGILVPDVKYRLLTWSIENGQHVLIVGPRGCGKTTCACGSARVLGRPCEIFHIGGFFDAEASVTGSLTFRDGETSFVRSRLIDALTTPNCVIIFDEFNRVGPKVHAPLLSATDHQRRIVLDLESPERRIVDLAPGVVFVATANMGAEYTGTEVLDAALLDRFSYIRLDYPDGEEQLLRDRGAKARYAKRIVKVAREIRTQYGLGAFPASISTRGVEKVADIVQGGFTVEEAFEAAVAVFDDEGLAALRTILGTVK
jgi:nitric oxide reductase NorQ protein